MEETKTAAETSVKKPRRVGTVAFGLVLVVAGVLLIAHLFIPFNLISVIKFSPAILVVLGIEVLVYAAKPNVVLKYDFLSMFACAVILVLVGGASIVPQIWEYAGPEAEARWESYRREMEELTAQEIAKHHSLDGAVDSCDVNLYHHDLAILPETTDVQQLGSQVSCYYYFTLAPNFASEEEFAATCKEIMDACKATGLSAEQFTFTSRYPREGSNELVKSYRLSVDALWRQNASKEDLVSQVEITRHIDGYDFDTELSYNNYLAEKNAPEEEESPLQLNGSEFETAEQLQEYVDSLLQEARDEGYQQGFEEGLAALANE